MVVHLEALITLMMVPIGFLSLEKIMRTFQSLPQQISLQMMEEIL